MICTPRDWPGAKTLAKDIGTRVIRVRRPHVYFDPDADWPDELELHLVLPAALEARMKPEEARRRIEERVRKLERAALEKSKKTGRPFLGARRVIKAKHTRRASSYEVFGSLNPRFSAAGDHEAARRKVEELRRFDADYEDALARWTAGDREAAFPHGTWWMRVHHGARCRPPPG